MVSTLLTGLVSYYKCDTNGSCPDSHGSNDGTINGATFNSSGKINGDYLYDGINDNITFGSDWFTNGVHHDFSVSAWIKSSSWTGDHAILTQRVFSIGSTGSISFSINSSGNVVLIYWDTVANSSARYAISTATVSADSSYHLVVGAYDQSAGTFYIWIDNSKETHSQGTGSSGSSGRHIGGGTEGRPFNGEIDEVGVWSKILSDSEASELYNSGAGLQYPFTAAADNAILFGTNF